jgi:hypothetical protein
VDIEGDAHPIMQVRMPSLSSMLISPAQQTRISSFNFGFINIHVWQIIHIRATSRKNEEDK